MSLYEEEIRTQKVTSERPCEVTGGRQPSASQGERPQKKQQKNTADTLILDF